MSLELITMCACQQVAKMGKAVGNMHGQEGVLLDPDKLGLPKILLSKEA